MIKSFNLDPDLLFIWDKLQHKSEFINVLLRSIRFSGFPSQMNYKCFGTFSCPEHFNPILEDCCICAESYFGIDKIHLPLK